MIKEFVQIWDTHKGEIESKYKAELPKDYEQIVKDVMTMIHEHMDDDYNGPDPSRVHKIDDGDYQGTLVFVVAAYGYQPTKYWYVKVDYGSCSGCDSLERALSDSSYGDPPSDSSVKQCMMLALHIVQRMKEMIDEE